MNMFICGFMTLWEFLHFHLLCWYRTNAVEFVSPSNCKWRLKSASQQNYFLLVFLCGWKQKLTDGMSAFAKRNNWCGVIIWLSYGLCRLACAARRLMVPPTPSHGPLPWDVAKIDIISGMDAHRLAKFSDFVQLLCTLWICDYSEFKQIVSH